MMKLFNGLTRRLGIKKKSGTSAVVIGNYFIYKQKKAQISIFTREQAINIEAKAIKYIEDPTEQEQLWAVERNPLSLRHIKNPTDEVIDLALEINGLALQYVPEGRRLTADTGTTTSSANEKRILSALRRSGTAIKCIDNPTEEMQMVATSKSYEALAHLDYPSEEVIHNAILTDGHAIKHVPAGRITARMCLAAVRYKTEALDLIPKEFKHMCALYLVRKGALSLFRESYYNPYSASDLDKKDILVAMYEWVAFNTNVWGFNKDDILTELNQHGSREEAEAACPYLPVPYKGKVKFGGIIDPKGLPLLARMGLQSAKDTIKLNELGAKATTSGLGAIIDLADPDPKRDQVEAIQQFMEQQ